MTEQPTQPTQPKLSIEVIPVTPLQQNTSMIWSTETMEGVFIDPGGEVDRLMGRAEANGVKIVAVWLTHGHLDHAGAATAVKESSARTKMINGCSMRSKRKGQSTGLLTAKMFNLTNI